jgi:hypothetical protein
MSWTTPVLRHRTDLAAFFESLGGEVRRMATVLGLDPDAAADEARRIAEAMEAWPGRRLRLVRRSGQ